MKDDFLSDVIFSPVLNWIWVWETIRSKLNPDKTDRARHLVYLKALCDVPTVKVALRSVLTSNNKPLWPLQWKSHPREEWRFGSKVTNRNLSSPLAHKHKQAHVQIRTFLNYVSAWGAVEAVIFIWFLCCFTPAADAGWVSPPPWWLP